MDVQQKIKLSIRILSFITIVIGICNLIGWYFQIPFFVELIPGLTPMMYNTGFCFGISGIALMLLSCDFVKTVRVIITIPAIISFLTLFQYFLNIDLNIDNLIFDVPENSLVFFKGRMAVNTALGFFLSSLSIYFIVVNTNTVRNWIASCSAAVVLSFGFVAFFGYFFGIAQSAPEYLKYSAFDTLMAYHTGIAFIILGTAIYLSSLTYTRDLQLTSWWIIPIALTALAIQINLWNMVVLENKILDDKGISYTWQLFGLMGIFAVVTLATIYYTSLCIRTTLKLEQAKIQFQTNSESRERLLHHVSHEIKNPLNAIMGFTGLLLENKEEGEEKKTLESIQSSSAHILNLTKDLLAISRLESGNLDLVENEFAFQPWIKELTNLIQSRAKLKSIRFDYHLDERIPEKIYGDYSKIAQIIFNFTDNALKFTPSGKSIELFLNYLPISKKKFQLEIAVKDSGPGVPPEARQKIFEPFSQLQTFEKGQGTGLGLSICTTYSKMMQGEIGVISCEGEGSTFFSKIQLKTPSPDTSSQNSPTN